MKKIVLTGGPCAGKTTVLEVLRREFAGKALVVPEVATMLLSGGFPLPGKDMEWSPKWQEVFQTAVLPVQIQLEAGYELVAAEKGAEILICDRGLLDGAAYTPGGVNAFCKKYGVDHSEALARYEAVLHLESLSVGDPDLYGKTNNTSRFEEAEEAVRLEYATREVWKGHPQWNLLTCKKGLEGKIAGAIEILKQKGGG